MITNDTKSLMKKFWLCYLLGFLFVFGLKYFYSQAGCNELKWILTPTAWWVGILTGIPFTFESGTGYVNHGLQFIIARSCCGVQFMLITIAALIFSYLHRMNTRKKGLCWVAVSLFLSYVYTIFINGFRIVISIYLPVYLIRSPAYQSMVQKGFMTPQRLHSIIGIGIYFTALFLIYQLTGRFLHFVSRSFAAPVFWYLAFVLGIPVLTLSCLNNGRQFLEYAGLLLIVCAVIAGTFALIFFFFRRIMKLFFPKI